MRSLLLVTALIGLAACHSNYQAKSTDRVVSQPPTDQTGSMAYPTFNGPPARQDTAPPANPTGSMTPQTSGPGPAANITAAPPKNPTGSMAYPY